MSLIRYKESAERFSRAGFSLNLRPCGLGLTTPAKASQYLLYSNRAKRGLRRLANCYILVRYSASIPPYQRAQPQSCRTKGGNSRRNMTDDIFMAYSIAVILDSCNSKGNALGLSSVVGVWFFPPNPLPTSTIAMASPLPK